ncbi:MAG: DUF72 domain-containing protein, partial [Verrucomicrobia bacterium]|nr:DUF72 domain-containing protein [Cytophagales bacterium]
FHYAKQFNTIELNTTHYRIPDPQTVKKWYENADEGFKFCPKLPQEISHEKKLRNVMIETQIFCKNIAGLKEKLGVCFLQLPPYFSPAEINFLEDFLKLFPVEIPLAIEFRHEDFFKKSHLNKTFDLLEKYHISPVITDVAGRRDVLHQRFTTDTVLIRWVGDKLHPTDYQRLDLWVEKLTGWLSAGLKNVYFFIHQIDNTTSADLVAYFITKLNQQANLNLKIPVVHQQAVQGKLF